MASLFLKRGRIWVRIKNAKGRWTNRPTGLLPGQEEEAARTALEMQAAIVQPFPDFGRVANRGLDHLYIITSSCGAIKIGRTRNYDKRLRELAMSCPPSITLKLYAVAIGMGDYETSLHERFDSYRLRGEWFSKDLGDLIRKSLQRQSLSGFVRMHATPNGRRGIVRAPAARDVG